MDDSYDMSRFLPPRKVKYPNDAEVTGPIKKVCIPGKGRGIIATEDISRGQLLIVSRAFEIIFDYKPESQDLENAVVSKLLLQPDLRQSVYELHAGQDLGHISPPQDHLNLQGQSVPSVQTTVNMERIRKICAINAFGNSDEEINSRGLWILPSFLNHDCIDFNCMWECLGDLIFIRAVRDISKDDELLVPYGATTDLYEQRSLFLQTYGFVCQCRLCVYQENEDPGQRASKMEMFLEMENMSEENNDATTDIFLLEKSIPTFEKMRWASEKPYWDFFLSDLYVKLHKLYTRVGNVQKKKAAAEKYYNIVNGCPKKDGNGFICIDYGAARHVVKACLECKDILGASNWINCLKNDLSTVYGKSNVFCLMYPRLSKRALQQKIYC